MYCTRVRLTTIEQCKSIARASQGKRHHKEVAFKTTTMLLSWRLLLLSNTSSGRSDSCSYGASHAKSHPTGEPTPKPSPASLYALGHQRSHSRADAQLEELPKIPRECRRPQPTTTTESNNDDETCFAAGFFVVCCKDEGLCQSV